MLRPYWRIPLSILVVSVVAASAVADLTPDQKSAAQALIAQFTAPEFAVRQRAVEKLIQMGPLVVPLIKATLAETRDNEVKTRCTMVLQGIAARRGFDASRVTFAADAMPLSTVLELLADQSGNRRLEVPNTVAAKPVTLAVKDMTYWEALDAICRSAGLQYEPTAERPAFHLVDAAGVQDIGGYAGPVVVKLTSCTQTRQKSREFRRREGGDPLPAASQTLSWELTCFWEDRLPVVVSDAWVTTVTAPDGRKLIALEPEPNKELPEGFPEWHQHSSYSDMGNTGVSGELQFSLPEVPAGLQKFATVEGVVRLKLGVGEKSIEVGNIFQGQPKTTEADGISVTLNRATRDEDTVHLSLIMVTDGRCPMPSLGKQANRFGLKLQDPKGALHSDLGGGGFSGSGWGTGFRGQLEITVCGVPDIPGEWTLIYTYPEKLEPRDYPFKIRDVPVP